MDSDTESLNAAVDVMSTRDTLTSQERAAEATDMELQMRSMDSMMLIMMTNSDGSASITKEEEVKKPVVVKPWPPTRVGCHRCYSPDPSSLPKRVHSPPHSHRCRNWCTAHGPNDHTAAHSPRGICVNIDDGEDPMFLSTEELQRGQKAAAAILQSQAASRALMRTLVLEIVDRSWAAIFSREKGKRLEKRMDAKWDTNGRIANVKEWLRIKAIQEIVEDVIDAAVGITEAHRSAARRAAVAAERARAETARTQRSPKLSQLHYVSMNPMHNRHAAKVVDFKKTVLN